MPTNNDLLNAARSWLGNPYMYGNNGLVITESLIQAKAKQYPANYANLQSDINRWGMTKIDKLRLSIGKRAVQCNSFTSMLLKTERSANGWLSVATESGSISTIPPVAGVTVHFPGHMGVYDGAGFVIEAKGTFYGVVKTALNTRPWRSWAKMPGITYELGDIEIMLKRGDKDLIKGGNMGTAVANWQKALEITQYEMKDNSGRVYPPDGSFGGATENATKNFQRSVNLPVTGRVDIFTYSAMIDALLAIAANRVERAKLDSCRAIIADAIITLERGVL